jgi:hypothetical protein
MKSYGVPIATAKNRATAGILNRILSCRVSFDSGLISSSNISLSFDYNQNDVRV